MYFKYKKDTCHPLQNKKQKDKGSTKNTDQRHRNWTSELNKISRNKNRLKFNLETIHYIHYQKISKISGIFCKARHYISLKILQILYFALVYPNLHNGNRIWATAYQSTLEPLGKIQRKIIRIITFSGYRDHTVPLFKKLGILPLDEIYKEKTSLFMFRHASSDIQ